MNFDDERTTYFSYCRDLRGRLVHNGAARRNGRVVPRFDPALNTLADVEPPRNDFRDESKYYVNLNANQSQLWRSILSAQSIAVIARDLGLTRPAVYSRIATMARRNYWVWLWWNCRQLMNRHDATD